MKMEFSGSSIEPWQMTESEWLDAIEKVKPGYIQSNFLISPPSRRRMIDAHNELHRLYFGVNDVRMDTLRRLEGGEINMTNSERDDFLFLLSMPIQYEDVIQRAIELGLPVTTPSSCNDFYA